MFRVGTLRAKKSVRSTMSSILVAANVVTLAIMIAAMALTLSEG
jgi:hypothetical protein